MWWFRKGHGHTSAKINDCNISLISITNLSSVRSIYGSRSSSEWQRPNFNTNTYVPGTMLSGQLRLAAVFFFIALFRFIRSDFHFSWQVQNTFAVFCSAHSRILCQGNTKFNYSSLRLRRCVYVHYVAGSSGQKRNQTRTNAQRNWQWRNDDKRIFCRKIIIYMHATESNAFIATTKSLADGHNDSSDGRRCQQLRANGNLHVIDCRFFIPDSAVEQWTQSNYLRSPLCTQ